VANYDFFHFFLLQLNRNFHRNLLIISLRAILVGFHKFKAGGKRTGSK
jgi:hypothetical protein